MRRVTVLVLAAGSSRRLGRPKQLLPYEGRTLLDASLDVARSVAATQRLVTVGGAAPEVVARVDTQGFEVVDSVHHTDGCSSSIVAALEAVDPGTDGIVLLLGDQPGVRPETIEALIRHALPAGAGVAGAAEEAAPPASLAVCRYDDGIGHPFWFGRAVFDELRNLHGDKGVWKLIESGAHPVVEVPIAGAVPLDVDTWEDYERLLAASGAP